MMQTDQLQQLFALFKDLQDKIENGEILVQDDMIEREMHAKNAAQCQWENQQLDLQLYNLRKKKASCEEDTKYLRLQLEQIKSEIAAVQQALNQSKDRLREMEISQVTNRQNRAKEFISMARAESTKKKAAFEQAMSDLHQMNMENTNFDTVQL